MTIPEGPTPNSPRVTGQWRRRQDHYWWWKLIHFLLAPLVDDWRGLSLTRFIAIALVALLWHAVETQHNITPTMAYIATLALAAAFGKSTFELIAAQKAKEGG